MITNEAKEMIGPTLLVLLVLLIVITCVEPFTRCDAKRDIERIVLDAGPKPR